MGDTAPPRWPTWLNATGLLVVSFATVGAMSLQALPGAEIVAVAYPPWWTSQQIFEAAAAADAAVVRITAIPSVIVVRPDHRNGLTRLREAGAWLAIDPQAVAACFRT